MLSFRSLRIAWPAYGLIFILLAGLLGSCGSTRTLVYMQGQFDTAKLSHVLAKQDTIQKGDVLSIIIYSDNPEATKIYNQPVITTGGSAVGGDAGGIISSLGTAPPTGGYMVDENGNIEFQGLGLLHVDSMTKAALRDTILNRLKDVLTNPYCTIRIANHRFTMLGEINRPGIFTIPGDHLNLLEALGLAGDMTFYGRRDNILVVREVNGRRTFGRMDITKPEIMASPYFYLQSNDVVIVEPNSKKVPANDQTLLRNISIVTSVITLAALLYSIFKK